MMRHRAIVASGNATALAVASGRDSRCGQCQKQGMDNTTLLIFVTATFVFAGFVKGVIGLGLPTIAVGILGVVMAPAQAAALLVVPNLVTNGWQIATGPKLLSTLRRLWPMLATICLGTWAGAGLLQQQKDGSATLWLGAALILYALSA